jgi:hypothetical protein
MQLAGCTHEVKIRLIRSVTFTNKASRVAPPVPIMFGVPRNEWGLGGSIGGGGSLGAGAGIGVDVGKAVVFTNCRRVCVTKALTITLGASTPGAFGSVGPVANFALNGRLDGPSFTVGIGFKAAAALAGGAVSFDVDPSNWNTGAALQWSPGVGGLAGVRFQFSCTGCATIRSLPWGLPAAYVNAEGASNQCILNALLRLVGLAPAKSPPE